MTLKKGGIYETTIEKVSFPNKGIGKAEGETVVIKNTIPGQKVQFVVRKKRSNHYTGSLIEVAERSALETRGPLCSNYPRCGGCTYQTMGYEHQLEMKLAQVKELLSPVFQSADEKNSIFEGIIHAEKEYPFRNKMEYTFGDEEKGGELTLGLHKKDSRFDILPVTDCAITHNDFNLITTCIQEYCRRNDLPYYHRASHEGYLRNLLVRRGEHTGEILIAIVTSTQILHDFSSLVHELLALNTEGTITGILHIFYDGVADIVRSDSTAILYGRDYIYDELMGLKFKIGAFSFFQTNTCGAEVLYETVREFIGDIKDAEVFDLYSGTGTIAQMLAPAAARVTGVEIVEEAVLAAKENARLNGIDNCEFICGDVLKVIENLLNKPDFIILDPPRDGINPRALTKIIEFGAERIVYVSCKPTSLARDLEMLIRSGYKPMRIRCVDMFPESYHVETVVLLSDKKVDGHINIDLDVEKLEDKSVASK